MKRPDVIAHRGASAQRRENTNEAFRAAVELGADGVELDLRRTRDGALVVHHDAIISGAGPIIETDRADLAAHVPTLDEALAACGPLWVNIEIKNSPEDPDFDPGRGLALEVAELDRQRAALGGSADPRRQRWLISSFDLVTVDLVRDNRPELETGYLVIEITDAIIERAARCGHTAIHPWVDLLTREQVVALHAAGLRCMAWTCNDAERIAELVDWGVDGICTDDVMLARRVIDRGGRH